MLKQLDMSEMFRNLKKFNSYNLLSNKKWLKMWIPVEINFTISYINAKHPVILKHCPYISKCPKYDS